jgi:hypothetical protein
MRKIIKADVNRERNIVHTNANISAEGYLLYKKRPHVNQCFIKTSLIY